MSAQPKTKGTKLGHRLRLLADKPEFQDYQPRLQHAAAELDKTAIVLGLRGDRIKQTASYTVAARLYQTVTGRAYVG